jgi:nucleotide-binding universal stress UspA family protein
MLVAGRAFIEGDTSPFDVTVGRRPARSGGACFGQSAIRARSPNSRRSREMKILVAYDGGEPARRALELTSQLAKAFSAEVAVISVVPVHGGRVPTDPWDDDAVHRAQLAEAKLFLRERGIAPRLIERAGDPGPTIEHFAEANGFDTVVVGSRSLNAVSRFLQGSVSEHVATHGTATVIVAR